MCGWMVSNYTSGNIASAMKKLAHRGPDSQKYDIVNDLLLAHTRLAVLHLDEKSNQPLSIDNNRYWLIYNGEIYNFKELRDELLREGLCSEIDLPESDTHLLAQYLKHKGLERTVKRLQGMYAFMFLDKVTGNVSIARDPLGIKPLYFVSTDNGITFGSTAKAVAAYNELDMKLNDLSLFAFRKFGFIPDAVNLFSDITIFPAGGNYFGKLDCFDIVSVTKYKLIDLFDVPQKKTDIKKIELAIKNTVKKHLISDVDIGVLLSGGIDSGALLQYSKREVPDTKAITIYYDEFKNSHNDELTTAELVAKALKVMHITQKVTVTDFLLDLQNIAKKMDRPTIDGINVWFATKVAKENKIKVVLSGVGVDEFFGGYQTLKMLKTVNRFSILKPIILPLACLFKANKKVQKLFDILNYNNSFLAQYLQKRALRTDAQMQESFGYSVKEVQDYMQEILNIYNHGEISNLYHTRGSGVAVAYLETIIYMRSQLLLDGDWSSMGQSVELRTPFVDLQFLKSINAYLEDQSCKGKRNFIEATGRAAAPRKRGSKTGFGIPIDTWIKKSSTFKKKNWIDQVETFF